MSKKIAIVQSNYIPWKGYFDMVNMVDEFVLYDSVQYTKNDWRNRNLIKGPNGSFWLTIPVLAKGRFGQDINRVKIAGHEWRKKHLSSIEQSYRKAPHFEEHRERFRTLYLDTDDEFLSDINHRFMTEVCDILGIATKISWSTDYRIPTGDRTGRLIEVCQQTGADAYLSGPAAREYLDRRSFAVHGIAVEFMDYSDYAEYPQLYLPFEHAVSVLDLIFNQGPNATCFMKSFGRGQVGV